MGQAVAVAGIGALGSFMGGNAAAKGYEESAAVQREQLAFEKERYDDWKAVYGTLQEDLGEYYKNLTGEELTTKQLVELQTAQDKANTKIQETLAQRGLKGSGVEASILASNMYKGELQEASVRANSEEQANNQKMKFLALGLNQGQAIAGNMANISTNIAQTAIGAGNAQADMWGNITGSVIHGVNQYYSNDRSGI